MKCWDEYTDYLKDNPKGYWFKNKMYGYGWTPATRAGWITTLTYLVFLLVFAWYGEKTGYVDESTPEFILIFIGATILLILVCWRTGEPLRWNWGNKNKK